MASIMTYGEPAAGRSPANTFQPGDNVYVVFSDGHRCGPCAVISTEHGSSRRERICWLENGEVRFWAPESDLETVETAKAEPSVWLFYLAKQP